MKEQILDRLWEREIMLLENSPTAEKEVSNTLEWLGREIDHRTAAPIRDYLLEGRRLLQTGERLAAIRQVRAAIRNVNDWF